MYQHIEDEKYKHLICIIIGGTENENKLHGLAHVGEHMCLLPCFQEDYIDDSYSTFGYTCIDHTFLYFTSQNENSLNIVRSKIENKSIVRKDRVEIAKHQVVCECEDLKNKISENEKIVKFVTENRIRNFAAGKVEDIKKIEMQDVWDWLNAIIVEHRILFFSLEELKNKMVNIQIILNEKKRKQNIREREVSVQILYMDKCLKEKYDAEIYVPINMTFDKTEYLEMIIGENYLEKYLSEFADTVEVSEKFFSYRERYLLIRMKNILFNMLPVIIEELRNGIKRVKKSSYLSYKEMFYKKLVEVKAEYENDNSCILNALVNSILYDIPQINIETEIGLFDKAEDKLCMELEESLKRGMKIIIR